MSVYINEKKDYLFAAMQSILNQTIKTDDFILVCDGPLTPELDTTIYEMERLYPEILHVIRLEKNGGLGNALNIGIKKCKNELVARMDSDDISRPDRCEKQLRVFMEHPEISICSGIVEEFTNSIDNCDTRRVPPETQDKIIAFAKSRNPFNHPCVMYKKTDIEASGGYQDFYLLEDYFLWIRMFQNGFVGYNLQEPLLWMRAGSEMYKRRSGWKYVKSQIMLFKYMKDSKFISSWQYIKSIALRIVASMAPNWLRVFLYNMAVRN